MRRATTRCRVHLISSNAGILSLKYFIVITEIYPHGNILRYLDMKNESQTVDPSCEILYTLFDLTRFMVYENIILGYP
jgi:hypothetical protein